MGKLEKYVFGEAGVNNLILGIFIMAMAVSVILFMYGYLSGMASHENGQIVLATEGISGLPLIMLLVLVFGIISGYEIGRYVQTQFTKRRKERLKSE